MIKIAITGGIGSGKSYIASQLTQLLGIPVYDSDREAKRLIVESATLRKKLTEVTGMQLYDSHGQLRRSEFAAWLFSSQENVEKVNAIVHPAVIDDFLQWADRQNAQVVAIESALVQESGIDAVVDKVIRVDAPLETRIRRAMDRDNATREQVIARINRQTQYPNPDIIINND